MGPAHEHTRGGAEGTEGMGHEISSGWRFLFKHSPLVHDSVLPRLTLTPFNPSDATKLAAAYMQATPNICNRSNNSALAQQLQSARQGFACG